MLRENHPTTRWPVVDAPKCRPGAGSCQRKTAEDSRKLLSDQRSSANWQARHYGRSAAIRFAIPHGWNAPDPAAVLIRRAERSQAARAYRLSAQSRIAITSSSVAKVNSRIGSDSSPVFHPMTVAVGTVMSPVRGALNANTPGEGAFVSPNSDVRAFDSQLSLQPHHPPAMQFEDSSWNACREHPLPADVLSAVRCPWKQFDKTRFLTFASFVVLLLQRHGRLI